MKTKSGALFLALCGCVLSQNMLVLDMSNAPATPRVHEFSFPINTSNLAWPPHAVLPAAPPQSFPLPPFSVSLGAALSDMAFDNYASVVFASSGAEISQSYHPLYPRFAGPPAYLTGTYAIPGGSLAQPVTAIAYDSISNLIWAIQQTLGVPGSSTIVSFTPVFIGGSALAVFTTPTLLTPTWVPTLPVVPTLVGLDWISTACFANGLKQASLIATDAAGTVYQFTVGVPLVPGPPGQISAPFCGALSCVGPPPPGQIYAQTLAAAFGCAVHKGANAMGSSLGEYNVGYQTNANTAVFTETQNVPYLTNQIPAFIPFNQIGDIAYHNYPQVVPGSCACAPGGGGPGFTTTVGTMGPITWAASNQTCVPFPGPGRNVVLALFGPPVGTVCTLGLDFTTTGVPISNACGTFWLSFPPPTLITPLTVVPQPVGPPAATFNFGPVPLLPLPVPFNYAQWAIPCPSDPSGAVLSDAQQIVVGWL